MVWKTSGFHDFYWILDVQPVVFFLGGRGEVILQRSPVVGEISNMGIQSFQDARREDTHMLTPAIGLVSTGLAKGVGNEIHQPTAVWSYHQLNVKSNELLIAHVFMEG